VHDDLAHDLLADEVADLDLVQARLRVLLHVDVDGEMGVDVAHLVLEALGHADDHVVDQRADGAEGGDVLARAVVELDVDDVLLWVREVDGQMAEVLDELACALLDSWFRAGACASRGSSSSCGLCVEQGALPLAPSTVTNLDLMVTLTVGEAMSAPALPFNAIQLRSASAHEDLLQCVRSTPPPSVSRVRSVSSHLLNASVPSLALRGHARIAALPRIVRNRSLSSLSLENWSVTHHPQAPQGSRWNECTSS
jgi:hypothetical protein